MRSGTVDGLNANAGVNQRCVTVELLTGETILISIEGKTTCSAIWNRVECELVARGVVHPQIFGLAVKTGPDWVFVDLDEKLSKYFPKEGKSTSSSSSTSSSHHHHNNPPQHSSGPISERSKPALVLYVRVHFYLEAIPQTFDVVTLLHYYLQLRQNLIAAPRCPVANLVQAVAYALQSELGDWRPCISMPRWAHSLKATLGPALTRSHQACAGLSQQPARLAFIRAVIPQYNMHMFGMTLKTKEGKDAPAWIGVTPKGIEIYQNTSGAYEIPDQPRFTFLWANITKLYFERKKFEIRGVPCPWLGSNQKLSFTAASELVPRHLLLLCRSTHQFPLTNGKLLLSSDQQQLHNNHHHSNGNGHKASSLSSTGGESSCNSTLSSTKHDDNKMLDLSLWADGLLLTGESGEHQRVSVISNGSSNTTSGIVSDRVYSLDGSEEDLEIREISDICTERAHHRNNSTSLESLSHNHHRHPPVPTKPRHHAASHPSGGSNSTALSSTNGHHDGNHHNCDGEDGSEAKYWYCDSDCEQDYEQTETTPPCRSSLLVRTIGEKRGCAGHCECNCCTAEEDEVDGILVDGEPTLVHQHHNSPSMASETTLKAVDINSGMELESSPNQQNGLDKDQEKVCTEDAEEYKLEDEHVYGEISDELEVVKPSRKKCSEKHDCGNNKNNCERQYSVIEEKHKCGGKSRSESGSSDSDSNNKKAPRPKPRYSCVKMVDPQKRSCKCMPKERCCIVSRKVGPAGGICKHKTEKILCNNGAILSGSNGVTSSSSSSSACGKECRRSYSTNVVSPTKENGFTPKIASLKCLKSSKQHGKSTCCSNVIGEDKGNQGKHVAYNMKSRRVIPSLPPSQQMNNYVEFGEKLQQGRYPSTRTVSDNFDTDSDYVQLPPLMPPPLPKKPNSNKLWKIVGMPAKACTNPTSSSPTPPQVNMSTLPRRKPAEASNMSHGSGEMQCVRSNLLPSKPSSRSTTALNLLSESKRPEPPPKPRKSMADLTSADTTPIDARIISTKPQIQIQTAYASPAPIAIPATSKVLYRPPRLPMHHLTHHQLGMLQHSKSVDNIYDTVAAEEPFIPTVPAPPYPSKSNASIIIHPNNYIDVHASSRSKLASQQQSQAPLPMSIPVKGGNIMQQQQYLGAGLIGGIGSRCGSVPNNLNNFLIGLQNLKPLSRAPIVHPAATSCMSLAHSTMVPSGVNGMIPGSKAGYDHHNFRQHSCVGALSVPGPPGMPLVSSNHPITTSSTSVAGNPRFTTVYTNQLTRSQIQQFKAQLYSDLDYVIFPPKDPRVSQQEYFDSKGLGYTTITNSNPMLGNGIACAYSMSDIPPPYLPPPPPYPISASSGNLSKTMMSNANGPPPPLPGRMPKVATTTVSTTSTTPSSTALGKPVPPVNVIPSATTGTGSLSNQSLAATLNTSSLYHHNSYQSLYNVGSAASHCSSSQYGYYGGGGVSGLNAENLQKFLSTQSFAGSNSSAAIYYPSSTQSAPPLPPYKNNGNVVVENGMRKAVQQLMASSRTAAGSGGGMMMTPASSATSALTSVDDRIRMKLLSRSEESLYAQPTNETEERLQAIYNLPPPPPYKRVANRISASHGQIQRPTPSEIDLASLRAKCKALDLPLLKALCSDGELMAKKPGAGSRTRVRPTAHAHPNPKLSTNPKLPPKQPTLPAKTTKPAPPPPPTCTVSSQKTANIVKA